MKSIEAHAVEIPYENDRYALLVVMPKAHTGISSLVKQFTLDTLDQIDRQMKEDHLHLAMPKVSYKNRRKIVCLWRNDQLLGLLINEYFFCRKKIKGTFSGFLMQKFLS